MDYHRHIQLLRENELPLENLRLQSLVVPLIVIIQPYLPQRGDFLPRQQTFHLLQPVVRQPRDVLRVNSRSSRNKTIAPGKVGFFLGGSQVIAHRHYLFNAHLRHSGKQAVKPVAEILAEIMRMCVEYSHVHLLK